MIRLLNPPIPTFQMTPTLLFLSQSLTFPNTSTLPWTSIPLQHQAIFPAMIRQIRIVLVKRPPLLKSCAYIQRFRFPTCLSTDTFFIDLPYCVQVTNRIQPRCPSSKTFPSPYQFPLQDRHVYNFLNRSQRAHAHRFHPPASDCI